MRRGRRGEAVPEQVGPRRVLVVNDEPEPCELLVRLLRAAPAAYEVDRARDQRELTERLLAEPAIDAVVIAVATGGIGGGLKLLDAVRGLHDQAHAAVPVVLVAASASSAMFSWQAGVDELLVRPFHAQDLVDAVGAAIERPTEERPRHRRQQLDLARTTGRPVPGATS